MCTMHCSAAPHRCAAHITCDLLCSGVSTALRWQQQSNVTQDLQCMRKPWRTLVYVACEGCPECERVHWPWQNAKFNALTLMLCCQGWHPKPT